MGFMGPQKFLSSPIRSSNGEDDLLSIMLIGHTLTRVIISTTGRDSLGGKEVAGRFGSYMCALKISM